MSKFAITATADDSIELIDFDESNSYQTIKDAIGGGYFDCVHIKSLGIDIWIDDEGKLFNNPQPNTFATALWVYEYGLTDYIAGDVIITGGVDDMGNTLALTADQAVATFNAAHETIIKASKSVEV